MDYNLDCDFERHNIFLNNNKHTALLRSTAPTSRDVAVMPVIIALLSINGLACHLPQKHIKPMASFHFACAIGLPAAPPTAPPSMPVPTSIDLAPLTNLSPPPPRIPLYSPHLSALSTTCWHTT